jgi:hypothetical protein
MRKWMLCVLALAMVGFTLDTAEAGGRRGRSYRSYSSYSSYSGGGYAPSSGWSSSTPTTQVYYVNSAGQLVPVTTSSEYTTAQRSEVASPATTSPGTTNSAPSGSVQPTSHQVITNPAPATGSAPVYQYAPMSYPVYYPSNCVGGG